MLYSELTTDRGTNVDTFTKAYIECALWASTDDAGEPLDGLYGIDDMSQECIDALVADCRDFQSTFAGLLALAGDEAQNGHDFWLTRNRHGAGFWDLGYGDVGQKLTEMAHPYGECNLYVGDDGKIHCQ